MRFLTGLLQSLFACALAPAVTPNWTPLPIRSPEQAAMGMPGGEGGQCLHGIARCPADDRTIYLAVDVAGVWKSTDAGVTWTPCLSKGLYCPGTSSIAVHPRDPDRVLVYTQALWEKNRLPEEGLYLSYDGGKIWARVLDVPNPDKRRGYRHLIDFAPNGRRIYFAAYDKGIHRSDDGGLTWTGPLGLRATVAWEVRCDPANPDTLYVATDAGLYVSHNAGANFRHLNAFGNDTISSIAFSDHHLYAVRPGAGLWRSTDGGRTSERIQTAVDVLDQEARYLAISPVDGRRLILAGETTWAVSHDAGFTWQKPTIDWSRSFVRQGTWGLSEGLAWSWRDRHAVVGGISCGLFSSSDGGLTWTDSMAGYTGFAHVWSNSAVAFSNDPKRYAFFCHDYAMVLTTDGGRTFYNGRLKEKINGWWGMYAGDISPNWETTPVIVAAAGNYWKTKLIRSEDAGRTWSIIADTDGAYFFIRFHPNDSNIVYAEDRRSDDGGRSYKKLKWPISAFAPSQPDTVYGYGQNKVWRSDDRGETWRALPDPPRPAGVMNARRDLQVDVRDPNRIWAMTPPDCAVFDGQSWRQIPASKWVSPRGHPFVSRFALDPTRPSRVILGLESSGTSYLFLSDDSGTTWTDITGNLPRLGANQSLNIQPQTGRVFVGAAFGTWVWDGK